MNTFYADTLIVGSGLAGLMAAQTLSSDQNVIVLTKGNWYTCNSYLAQGGIACVTDSDDSWHLHIEDTLISGNHHNDETSVKNLIHDSPSVLKKLLQISVPFDLNKNREFSRTKEGGHSRSRILHAGGDATGKVIMETLKASLPSHIAIHEQTQATELYIQDNQCLGVWARDPKDNLVLYLAKYIVLATGGLGQLYNTTTNAKTLTGDGIALAFYAGARCSDLEFIQFHPTLLEDSGHLISEAVRGEGAILRNQEGEAIMQGVHPLADLAPRDIVARAIFKRQLQGERLYLDIRPITDFATRFPNIAATCKASGVDLNLGLIPISPGAHFLMGGIETNDKGGTTLRNLFAIGETANTGVHGANRLASNSLLEAAGFAMKLANYINHDFQINNTRNSPIVDYLEPKSSNNHFLLPSKADIQKHVTENLGILRDPEHLNEMEKWLDPYIKKTTSISPRTLTKSQSEQFNMILVAWLMTQSMLERTESRGAHYRVDYPYEHPDWLKKRLLRERAAVEHV